MKIFLIIIALLISIFLTVGARCEGISDIDKFLREEEILKEEIVMEEIGEGTLVVWERRDMPKPYEDLYERFQNKSGWELKIERLSRPFEQNVLYKWQEGKRPDIINFHLTTVLYPGDNWFSKLDPEDSIIDLSNMAFVNNDKFNLLEHITTEDGNVLGAVITYPAMMGIVYNKEIFNNLSLEIPNNFEDFYDLCKTIKSANIIPIYGTFIDPEHLTYYSILWTDTYKNDPEWWDKINKGEIDFNVSGIVEGIEAIKKIIDDDYFQPFVIEGSYTKSHQELMDGKVAMVFQEDKYLVDLVRIYGLEEVNKKIGMFGLSMNSNTVSWQLSAPGAGYAIPRTGITEKEVGAWEFINFITTEGYQEFVDSLETPPVLENYNMPELSIRPYKEILDYFNKENYPIFSYGLKASWGPLEVYMQELFTKASSPELISNKMSNNFLRDAKNRGLME